MKGIFDTHCHYDETHFEKDRKEILNLQYENGVDYIVNCGSNIPSSVRSSELADDYFFMYSTVGVFPLEAPFVEENWMEKLRYLVGKKKTVAVGEIGLDYFQSNVDKEIQKDVFIQQLALAEELNLPVEIHNREADEDVLKIIDQFNITGDIHRIFSEEKYAIAFLDRGYFLGIGPQVTYPNSDKLIKTVKYMPIEKMLLETDCPFLPTKESEGLRAVSTMLEIVAEKIADIRGDITPNEVIEETNKNARKFFRI